jgi:hypothetical protein
MTEAQQKIIDELLENNEWLKEDFEAAGKEVKKPEVKETPKPETTYDTAKLIDSARKHPLYRKGL